MSAEHEDRPLAGQWAVITGASKGIGFGIASRFVDAGASVVLVARGVDTLRDASEELRRRASAGQSVVPLVADTADRAAITELFAAIRSEVPALNIFVANAGSGAIVPFLELTMVEWDRTLALNLTGTVHCCQLAARMMVESTGGVNKAILAVSSIRALGVRPGRLAYAVTKAGLNQFVRAAATSSHPSVCASTPSHLASPRRRWPSRAIPTCSRR